MSIIQRRSRPLGVAVRSPRNEFFTWGKVTVRYSRRVTASGKARLTASGKARKVASSS